MISTQTIYRAGRKNPAFHWNHHAPYRHFLTQVATRAEAF